MSTIHSALSRAQQEKDSANAQHPGSQSRTESTGARRRIPLIAAGAILLVLAGFAGYFASANHKGSDANGIEQVVNATSEPTRIARDYVAEAKPEKQSRSKPQAPKMDAAPTATIKAEPAKPEPVAVKKLEARPLKRPRRHKKTDDIVEIGKTAAVAEEIQKHVETKQPDRNAAAKWYKKGLESQLQEDYTLAEKCYQLSLEADPNFAKSLNNMAVIKMNTGDFESAGAGFEKAADADPDYADPLYNLACLEARRENPAASLAYIRMAVNIDPRVRQWVKEDEDFSILHGHYEFENIINPPGL